MSQKRKCIFFDRDGVLNRVVMRNGVSSPPWNIGEVVFDENAVEILEWFARKNWLTVVITNQPDARRGSVSLVKLIEIEKYFKEQMPIDGYLACYHDDRDGCDCRKPKVGSFLEASQKLEIDLKRSVFVGDRISDYNASVNAGVSFIGRVHCNSNLGSQVNIPLVKSLLCLKNIMENDYED